MRGGPEDPASGGEEGGVGAQPELLELVVAITGEHPALQESERRVDEIYQENYANALHVRQGSRHRHQLSPI